MDVYGLGDDQISEQVTEVFSRIRSAKMKPGYRWLGISEPTIGPRSGRKRAARR